MAYTKIDYILLAGMVLVVIAFFLQLVLYPNFELGLLGNLGAVYIFGTMGIVGNTTRKNFTTKSQKQSD